MLIWRGTGLNVLLIVSVASVLSFVSACTSVEVKDFNSWCRYVHDPKRADNTVLHFDRTAVVAGIVEAWDRIVVENSGRTLGIDPSQMGSDSVLTQLRRIRMVGAWRIADTLHLGLGLALSPVLDPTRTTAQVFADEYRQRMVAALGDSSKKVMDPVMYCLYSGLNLYFARIEVHASDSHAIILNSLFERLKTYN